ncbi:MAG: hypothetical protein AB7R89_03800 [Dehalococcoidia bacterium]
MTRAKDHRDVPSEGIEIRPGIYHHPRSPDASLETLNRLAGIITLTEPLPRDLLYAWMNDEEEEDGEDWIDRAGE